MGRGGKTQDFRFITGPVFLPPNAADFLASIKNIQRFICVKTGGRRSSYVRIGRCAAAT